MDGYLKNHRVKMVMFDLDRIIKFVFAGFLLFIQCKNKTLKSYSDVSIDQVGVTEYARTYSNLQDSFKLWVHLKLKWVDPEIFYPYNIDSLICFNTQKNRFIGCIHTYTNIKNASMDDIQYLYGEIIDSKWYFFTGPTLSVPRRMIKGHNVTRPLSYQQLHKIALSDIYSGYINRAGEINEAWFTSHFEGPGWGSFEDQPSQDWWLKGKRFKTKKEFYEFSHLEKVRSNWYGFKKDSVAKSSNELK